MKRWSQIQSFNKSFDPKLAEENCSILSAVTSIDTFVKNEVDMYLECLSMQNHNLVVLYNHRAIIRRDHNLLTDQVKILSGGASGNEPLHTGFVGQGLLTAAIMGDVNSCPSHTSILAVIRELSTNNSSGIFVIIMNYASYRLNFGIAIQNAVMEGIKIAAVIVEDDCSGVITDKTVGRRTLAGVIFMHKVVGAMAEDKKTLYEIECISKSISKNNLGTINIHIKENEVIFGVSLKGEDGTIKNSHKPNDSEQIVKIALSFIVDPTSYFSLALKKNDPVAILVNNFKGMSDFDLSVYINKVVKQVQLIPLNIVALYFGNYVSSQSILGFSITLFKVDNPRVKKWLCNQSLYSNWFPAKIKPLDEMEFYVEEQCALRNKIEPRKLMIGPKFNNEDITCIARVLCAIIHHLLKSEMYLNFLDIDHDLGTTMRNFASEIECKQSSNEINMTTPYALLTSLSEIAGYSMRGLSSAIYSILFSSAAQAFVRYSSEIPITYSLWGEAALLANSSLCNYIRVKPGFRTIVDALNPFAEALQNYPDDMVNAIQAAEKGVESTINMWPKALNAEGEPNLTVPDAGAYAFTTTVKAAYNAFINEY